MIDDKKIEAAAEEYNEKVENELEKKHIPKRTFAERYAESAISECAFKAGGKETYIVPVDEKYIPVKVINELKASFCRAVEITIVKN